MEWKRGDTLDTARRLSLKKRTLFSWWLFGLATACGVGFYFVQGKPETLPEILRNLGLAIGAFGGFFGGRFIRIKDRPSPIPIPVWLVRTKWLLLGAVLVLSVSFYFSGDLERNPSPFITIGFAILAVLTAAVLSICKMVEDAVLIRAMKTIERAEMTQKNQDLRS